MTDHATPQTGAASTVDELTDPESLRDRDDVRYRERTVVHDEEHLELNEPIDGWVMVGVANEEGEFMLTHNACNDVWLLPHARVDPGEDYAAVARREVEAVAGVDAAVRGVDHVRRSEFRLEGDEERRTVAHDVVVRASIAADEVIPDGHEVDRPYASDLGWFEETPENVPEDDPGEDVRLFLD